MPFVVDANAINLFQRERIESRPGVAHQALEKIFGSSCIALDSDGHCYQEWQDCAAGTYPFLLADWYADELVRGRIVLFDFCDQNIRPHLRKHGLPKSDHKWVQLSLGCGGKKIVTEDIDLFDPSLKKADARQKDKVKASGKGKLAKELKKTYGIVVMCLCHV